MIEALRHSFGELKLPSSQTLLTRNVPLRHGDNILRYAFYFVCFTPYIYIITPIYN